MPTYAQIADDIAVTLGYTTDDALRHRESILYNIKLVVDKLNKQILSRDQKVGDYKAMADKVSTHIVPVVWNDVADTVVTDFDAVYFDLPSQVYDLSFGGGINAVRYLRNELPMECPPAMARTPFTQTTLASLSVIYGSEYQKPSPKQPYFARGQFGGKDRVYLFGLRQEARNLLVNLYATPNFEDIDPDAEVNLPPELLRTAKKLLLEDEGWLLQIPQERLKNDGREFEPNQTTRVSPAISLNHPSQLDE